MIMVAKPAQLPAPPSFHHRRAPSAPVLAVQPTKTPGLLSLSKPQAPAKTQRQQRSPKSKPAQAATVPPQGQRSPKPAPAQASQVTSTTAASSPTPEQRPRGRQHNSKENKGRRNTSTSPSSRRSHAHQASPAPAEATSTPANAAARRPAVRRPQSFAAPKGADPFLVPAADLPSAAPVTGKSVRPTPALSAQPSGKLARRRRPGPDSPTPAHAKAVPVPHVTSGATIPLSRSVPTTAYAGPRRSNSTAPNAIAFPVCDDLTDNEDEPASFYRFDDGPQTAPQANFGFVGYNTPRTPSPRTRASSGGFVSGAFDEDYLNTPVDDVRSLLFGLSQSQAAKALQAAKDLRFANSQFQNSPSPEDLPSIAF